MNPRSLFWHQVSLKENTRIWSYDIDCTATRVMEIINSKICLWPDWRYSYISSSYLPMTTRRYQLSNRPAAVVDQSTPTPSTKTIASWSSQFPSPLEFYAGW